MLFRSRERGEKKGVAKGKDLLAFIFLFSIPHDLHTYGGNLLLGLIGPAIPASPIHNVAFNRFFTPFANVVATPSVGPLS